jgi:hypothetical protein
MAKKSEKKKKGFSWTEFKFAVRIWLRDYALLFSTIFTIVSIILIVFGALALFLYDTHADMLFQPLKDWIAFIHGAKKASDPHYDLCLFPLGILVLLFAGWYMGSGFVKRTRFNKLIETESKSEFIENMDEIEELAWDLSSKHEMMVVEKKEELGIDKKKR